MKKNEQAVIISWLVADLKKVRWAWWLCTFFLCFAIWLIFLGSWALINPALNNNVVTQVIAWINIVAGLIWTPLQIFYWIHLIIKWRQIRQWMEHYQKQPVEEN